VPERVASTINSFSAPEIETEGAGRGGISIENLSIKGALDEIMSTNLMDIPGALKASVRFDNLSFTHAAREGTFTGFEGGASIEDTTLTLRHISGGHNRSTLRDISGIVTDITGAPAYDLYVDGQFDAEELIQTIRPFMPGSTDSGAAGRPSIDASGKVDITARAKGTVETGYPDDISATASFKDAEFSHPSLPVRLEGLNGHASINNVDISLTKLSATDGHSKVTVNGRIRNYPSLVKSLKRGKGGRAVPAATGTDVVLDLTATGEIEFITLGKLFSEKALDGLYFDGPLSIRTLVAGPPGELNVRASVETTHAQLSYRNWIKKGKNFPLTLETDLLFGGGSIKVRLAEMTFGESHVKIAGDFRRDLRSYSFTMDTEGIRLTDIDNLSPLLRGDYDSKGIVTLSIQGSRADGKRPSYEGGIALKKGRFDTPLIARPVDRVDAEVLLTDNEAMIIVSSSIGESNVNARLEISDISKRVVQFELTSPRLNTADLLPEGLSGILSDGTARPSKRPPVTGGGVIYITSGNWWGHPIENFYTELTLGERTIDVHPMTIRVDSGNVIGELIYNRDASNPVLYRLTSEISGIDIETFITSAGAKKKVLEGGLDGTVSVWGKRGAPLRAGLNGNVNLLVGEGKLWKFILFSKIFSIVNIFSIDEFLQTGLKFNTLSGDYTITDGLIATEDMLLDSNSMTLSAVGEIDLKDSTMDSVLAMHPFVTIDRIITSIPIAGWIITGEEGRTVSMYYSIKGPLKDPVIDPIPKTRIASKVLGIFERLLQLPVQIIAPEELKEKKE
jgi:hypothetical protein